MGVVREARVMEGRPKRRRTGSERPRGRRGGGGSERPEREVERGHAKRS